MNFYSLNNPQLILPLQQAVQLSIAPDGGLLMPHSIPRLADSVVKTFPNRTFHQVSLEMLKPFFIPEVPESKLAEMIERAFSFDAPIEKVGDYFALELFHGPTLAFKDFGVRLMAELLRFFSDPAKEVTILTATSGDTGGAVASAFWKQSGFRVVILYPRGKISSVQEAQIATLGDNVQAFSVEGNFDDCQRMVKAAFADPEINSKLSLCSANSISVARLLPQICYYARAYSQLSAPYSVSVPSGNFGNVTAAVIAKQMGIPIKTIIATTNSNDIVPRYFSTGHYEKQPFVETLTTAMDIADPSNFPRLASLFGNSLDKLKEGLIALAASDDEVRTAMQETYQKNGYVLDPHGAAGLVGLKKVGALKTDLGERLFVETAHPSKFADTVSQILPIAPELPPAIAQILNGVNHAKKLTTEAGALKEALLT